ncbi:MAG: RNA polymerase sigma factor [Hyphomonadaceae bacterium]|nr:RNA polymerase sigma factor [Hyphomonadaceae bacterium]
MAAAVTAAVDRDVVESAGETEEAKDVLLAMAGDSRAFARLVAACQPWLLRLLWRILGDIHAAEDAAQLSFVKAWSNLHRLERPERFRSWLRAIAVRNAFDARRKYMPAASLDDLEDAADTRFTVERQDQQVDLAQALSRLSVAQRACVLLSQAEGLTHPEIAELLGAPIGTVKSHVARGLAILRQSLADWRTHR